MKKTGRLNRHGLPILADYKPKSGRSIGENVAVTRNLIIKSTRNAPKGTRLVAGK